VIYITHVKVMAPGPAPAHTGLSRRGHVVKAAKCIEGISFVFALPFGQFQVEIHHKTKLLILAQVGKICFHVCEGAICCYRIELVEL
jgi:hypothetical protein